jgi:hypothetical protein
MKTIRILLFALVWVSCAWFGSWEFNPNNSTRLFAAISMVEDGDATIDEFRDLTIDKAIFGPHAYLDKAPGMTLMALPAVALADAVTGERASSFVMALGDPSLARFLRLRLRLATATGPAVLTAIAAVLLFDMAAALTAGSGAGVGAGLFAALAYSLGTPIWGWSTTIFGHAAVAALYVIAVWCFWRASLTQGRRPVLIGGAALGWAVVVEYQAVLAGSAIAIWAVWRVWPSPRRWLLLGLAAAGGVVALLPLPLYNLFAFGTVFKVGYSGVVGFDGMQQGLFGLTWPRPTLLWEILFGERRGLFWVAPVLLVAPLGLAAIADERRTRDGGGGDPDRADGQRRLCLLGRRQFHRTTARDARGRFARAVSRAVVGGIEADRAMGGERGADGVDRAEPLRRLGRDRRAARVPFPDLERGDRIPLPARRSPDMAE